MLRAAASKSNREALTKSLARSTSVRPASSAISVQPNIHSEQNVNVQVMPFATALSDFMSPTHYEQDAKVANSKEEWSDLLAFASPESDFCQQTSQEGLRKEELRASVESSNANYMPLSTALSDFMSPTQHEQEEAELTKEEWSNKLSYASPESDFLTSSEAGASKPSIISKLLNFFSEEEKKAEWSHKLSHGSPESDFLSSTLTAEQIDEQIPTEWSKNYSFTSPEADFQSVDVNNSRSTEWSKHLSFASPEADFTSMKTWNVTEDEEGLRNEWSNTMSLASPEADFTYNDPYVQDDNKMEDYVGHDITNEEHRRLSMMEGTSISLASPESDFISSQAPPSSPLPPPISQYPYEKVFAHPTDTVPLPQTISEALIDKTQVAGPRPIVITETNFPFRITHVNDAWVGLCGYTEEEARGKTLGSLLQGPETDREKVSPLIKKLENGEEGVTVLTNYTKEGRKFVNLLRVGPLYQENEEADVAKKVTHFVGVLREIENLSDDVRVSNNSN